MALLIVGSWTPGSRLKSSTRRKTRAREWEAVNGLVLRERWAAFESVSRGISAGLRTPKNKRRQLKLSRIYQSDSIELIRGYILLYGHLPPAYDQWGCTQACTPTFRHLG